MAAAWTGDFVTLLGKHPSGTHPAGARFRISANRWEPFSVDEMPKDAPHTHRTLLATRDRVILLYSNAKSESWGGIYNPEADTWLPVRIPKRLHPTNTLRVGKAREGLLFFDVQGHWAARFDPYTGEWQNVALPKKRLVQGDGATMTWTGDRFILWGGIKKTMTDPGGGCENHQGPEGCDPMSPRYEVEVLTDGFMFRP